MTRVLAHLFKSLIKLSGVKYELLNESGFGANSKGGYTIGNYRIYTTNKVVTINQKQEKNDIGNALGLLAKGRIVLVNVSVSDLRQCWFYTLNNSPITKAAAQELKGDVNSFIKTMEQNYNILFPTNAAERVLIYDVNHKLANLDVISCPLPWEKRTPDTIKNSSISGYKEENTKMGLKDCNEGVLHGPLSSLKINAEYLRISRLRKSISDNGYSRNNNDDGDICGHLFVDDTPRASKLFSVRLDAKGNHRASVLVNLGWTRIPIRIYPENVIRLSEVDSWHYVKNSTYTREEAVTIFKNIFFGVKDSLVSKEKANQ